MEGKFDFRGQRSRKEWKQLWNDIYMWIGAFQPIDGKRKGFIYNSTLPKRFDSGPLDGCGRKNIDEVVGHGN